MSTSSGLAAAADPGDRLGSGLPTAMTRHLPAPRPNRGARPRTQGARELAWGADRPMPMRTNRPPRPTHYARRPTPLSPRPALLVAATETSALHTRPPARLQGYFTYYLDARNANYGLRVSRRRIGCRLQDHPKTSTDRRAAARSPTWVVVAGTEPPPARTITGSGDPLRPITARRLRRPLRPDQGPTAPNAAFSSSPWLPHSRSRRIGKSICTASTTGVARSDGEPLARRPRLRSMTSNDRTTIERGSDETAN